MQLGKPFAGQGNAVVAHREVRTCAGGAHRDVGERSVHVAQIHRLDPAAGLADLHIVERYVLHERFRQSVDEALAGRAGSADVAQRDVMHVRRGRRDRLTPISTPGMGTVVDAFAAESNDAGQLLALANSPP